jgi:(2Fe-2S) ferredoxin
VVVYPDGVLYGHVTAEDVPIIVQDHLLADRPVQRLAVEAW